MKNYIEIIENKRDEIKDLYFKLLEESYKVGYYTKIYIDEEGEIFGIQCVSTSECPMCPRIHLFTISPRNWDDEPASDVITNQEDIDYMTSKEGLEENDDEMEMFNYMFDELIERLSEDVDFNEFC